MYYSIKQLDSTQNKTQPASTVTLLFFLLGFLFLVGPTPSYAQSIHLAPAELPPLKTCKKDFCDLLEVIPGSSNEGLTEDTIIRVFWDKLWFIKKDGHITSFDLANRTIREVVLELRDAFEDATFITHYPEYDGRYLKNIGPIALGDTLAIQGDLGGVQVHATVGAIFGLSEVDELTGDSRLLSNGGVQLDFIGQYPFTKSFLGRARITFTSNEPQAIGNAVDSSSVAPSQISEARVGITANNFPLAINDDEPADIQTLISNTERFSIGMVLDWYFIKNDSEKRIGATLEYEIAWNALSDVPIPTFRKDGKQYNIFDIYPAERIGEVRQNLNKVEPISTIFAGASFHFPSSNNTSVHILVNGGWTEQIIRQISFQIPASIPQNEDLPQSDPSTLTDNTIQEGLFIWRAAVGMTLGTTLDIRADTIGSIKRDKNFDPLLRISLSKKFQLR